MSRRPLIALAALTLIAGACGDDSALDDIAAEVESGVDRTDTEPGEEPAEADDEPEADDVPTETDDSDEPLSLSDDERAALDGLSGGQPLSDAEAGCLITGMEAGGVDPAAVAAGEISFDEDLVVSDLILECVDNPAQMLGFVENFAAGFSLTAGFEVSTAEAGCMIGVIADSGSSVSDLQGPDIPSDVLEAVAGCLGDAPSQGSGGDTYGDNQVLDTLWDACADGDGAACDELYFASAVGSEYEAFGASCGEREPGGVGGRCGEVDEPNDYGDDPEFDALWDACADGDGAACDDLYFASPIGSVYEEFGNTCGDRFAESPGLCQLALE